MPGDRRRKYWDADVFLSYIEEIPERMPILEALLADSAHATGPIEIVTSIWTITEVAFAQSEKQSGQLSDEIEQRIEALWVPGGAIRLIEYHQIIAVEAPRLIRYGLSHGLRRLKPPDAAHLATAAWIGVDEFHTYNVRDFEPYANHVGFPICNPYTPTQSRML